MSPRYRLCSGEPERSFHRPQGSCPRWAAPGSPPQHGRSAGADLRGAEGRGRGSFILSYCPKLRRPSSSTRGAVGEAEHELLLQALVAQLPAHLGCNGHSASCFLIRASCRGAEVVGDEAGRRDGHDAVHRELRAPCACPPFLKKRIIQPASRRRAADERSFMLPGRAEDADGEHLLVPDPGLHHPIGTTRCTAPRLSSPVLPVWLTPAETSAGRTVTPPPRSAGLRLVGRLGPDGADRLEVGEVGVGDVDDVDVVEHLDTGSLRLAEQVRGQERPPRRQPPSSMSCRWSTALSGCRPCSCIQLRWSTEQLAELVEGQAGLVASGGNALGDERHRRLDLVRPPRSGTARRSGGPRGSTVTAAITKTVTADSTMKRIVAPDMRSSGWGAGLLRCRACSRAPRPLPRPGSRSRSRPAAPSALRCRCAGRAARGGRSGRRTAARTTWPA